MISDDHKTEVLAQALWLQCFGVTALRDDWLKWSDANKAEADKYRAKAREMIGVATGHSHSLGWLRG